MSSTTKTVQVIMGSVRAGRICPTLSKWVASVGEQTTGTRFEVVDLADWHLPMDDEPEIPMTGKYKQPHTIAWSQKVNSASGFVFVVPQYNWGYPAAVKNAIDHLFREWKGKPAVIVSYGGRGGGKATSQLQEVLKGVGMRVVPTTPALSLTHAIIAGGPINPDIDFADQVPALKAACEALVSDFNKE